MRKRITTLGGNREPSFLVCVGANWKQTPLPTYWLRYLCMQYSLMLHCKLVFLWSQKLLLTTANHNCSKLMEIIKKEWVSPLISESAFQISTCQLTYQQSLTGQLYTMACFNILYFHFYKLCLTLETLAILCRCVTQTAPTDKWVLNSAIKQWISIILKPTYSTRNGAPKGWEKHFLSLFVQRK